MIALWMEDRRDVDAVMSILSRMSGRWAGFVRATHDTGHRDYLYAVTGRVNRRIERMGASEYPIHVRTYRFRDDIDYGVISTILEDVRGSTGGRCFSVFQTSKRRYYSQRRDDGLVRIMRLGDVRLEEHEP